MNPHSGEAISHFSFFIFDFEPFLGAGMASVVVSFIMSTYYSVIIAYAIYYFFSAFRPETPWLDCKQRWIQPKPNCIRSLTCIILFVDVDGQHRIVGHLHD